MGHNLKPLFQQVMVLTGATSEIGVTTIHRAVEQGIKVFMIDQNEEALQLIQDEMRSKGYDSAFSVANPSEEEQLQFAADQCIRTFGVIDTWVNIPAVSPTDAKRLFEFHFWSMVNGSNVAIPFLQERGGVLINVGGSFRTDGLNGEQIDSASKEAVRGYTNALRRELRAKKSLIKVSLVLNSLPDIAAKGILSCARKPIKEFSTAAPFKSFLMRYLPFKTTRTHPSQGLLASGVGGIAITGGMAFFLLRKFRLI